MLYCSLRCLWSDDIFSEPFFIKVTSCLQNHEKYSDSLAGNHYLTLHSSQWSLFTMPVIQKHILKCRIPCDERPCRLIHHSPQLTPAPLADSRLPFSFAGADFGYLQTCQLLNLSRVCETSDFTHLCDKAYHGTQPYSFYGEQFLHIWYFHYFLCQIFIQSF